MMMMMDKMRNTKSRKTLKSFRFRRKCVQLLSARFVINFITERENGKFVPTTSYSSVVLGEVWLDGKNAQHLRLITKPIPVPVHGKYAQTGLFACYRLMHIRTNWCLSAHILCSINSLSLSLLLALYTNIENTLSHKRNTHTHSKHIYCSMSQVSTLSFRNWVFYVKNACISHKIRH